MRHEIQVLDRVKSVYASLRPSEQRVADHVLNHPEECTRCTISELAEQVGVSQPTVVRFVQAWALTDTEASNIAFCGTAAAAHLGRPISIIWGILTSSPGPAGGASS